MPQNNFQNRIKICRLKDCKLLCNNLDFDGISIDCGIFHGDPGRIAAEISRMDPDRILLLSDDTVLQKCGSILVPLLKEVSPLLVISGPSGEHLKSLEYLSACLEDALAWGVTRRSVIVGFGGGVVGNLAGLIAALLYRGVRFVHVPTTLLAMHDSVLSLKQAVNSTNGKNLIGIYYAPHCILMDTQFLDTLPPREWRSGLVEAIKNGLALRPSMIAKLKGILNTSLDFSPNDRQWLLRECLDTKLEVMAQDRFEKKTALVLEYGHTVGHAIELASAQNANCETISHGEAVGLGMLTASRIASDQCGLDNDDFNIHSELLAQIGAPLDLPREFPLPEVMALVSKDNKRGYINLAPKQVAMVLLSGIGKVAGDPLMPLEPVDISLIERNLKPTTQPLRCLRQAESIDVYMITGGIRSTVEAAVRSVLEQSYHGLINMWVFEDMTENVREWCETLERPAHVNLRYKSINAQEGIVRSSSLERVSRLRNHAITFGTAPLIAFIDDDNLWEPDHLASLLDTLQHNNALAAHCWRCMIDSSGQEKIPKRFIWRNPSDPMSDKLFEIYREAGVFSEHDAIVRDRVSLIHDGDNVGMVDMGEWLLRRSLFNDFKFPEEFSHIEIATMNGEDDKLLSYLRANCIETACTEQVTLKYRIGGFSNVWE